MSIGTRKYMHTKKRRTNTAFLLALLLCLCIVLGFAAAGYAQETVPSPTESAQLEYTILDQETPLAVVPTGGIWSVLNLVLAGAGGVLSVILLSAGLFSERGERRDEDAADFPVPREKQQKKISLPWMVASILSGTLAIVVFMLTQNIDETMVLADRWTPLMTAVILLQLIFGLLAFRRRYPADEHQYARP